MFYISLIFRPSHRTKEDKRNIFSSIQIYFDEIYGYNSNFPVKSDIALPCSLTITFLPIFIFSPIPFEVVYVSQGLPLFFGSSSLSKKCSPSFKPNNFFSLMNTLLKITSSGKPSTTFSSPIVTHVHLHLFLCLYICPHYSLVDIPVRLLVESSRSGLTSCTVVGELQSQDACPSQI